MNWWLILLACIIGILVLGIAIYLVLYFQSEEDANGAWLPKFIVILSITIACGTVLLLPYDVANRVNPLAASKFSPTLDTETMWIVVLWMLAGMAVCVIPFATFWYEAYDPDDERPGQQVVQASLYTLGIMFVFALLTGVLWTSVGFANIPYFSYASPPQFMFFYDPSFRHYNAKVATTMRLPVSLFVYAVAMLCGAGWVFFFFYGGVGLVAFPVDNISEFMNRPKPLNKMQFTSEMEQIAGKAQLLLKLADELRNASRKKVSGGVRNKINILRNETYLLERQQDRVIWAYQEAGGSPFVVYGGLCLGFIGGGLSMMWIVHIFVNNTMGANAFLNTMLINLDTSFSLLGVIAYAIFAFYLLWATFKGQIKIGMRLLFFQIHPMKKGDTLMNAFLFNCGLQLLTAVAVVQFCAQSFNTYAAGTAIYSLLNVYVLRLQGVGYIISYMQYCFVGVCILSIFWVILCPAKKKREDILKLPKEDDD
jgi:LMBR1 domain-containing protein 1